VFVNLLGAAKLALIRAAASTPPFDGPYEGRWARVKYEVAVEAVASRQVAVVRDRRKWADLGAKLIPLLDRVYEAVRAGKVVQSGQNIFIFRDGSKDGVTVEVGVEVPSAFESTGGVLSVATPAGEAASTVHKGPYSGLGAAHEAVIRWCEQHGRARANAWWEIYGDWHEDPTQLQTEVFYSLLPEQS
jgi:effector-binding domain-containing protein